MIQHLYLLPDLNSSERLAGIIESSGVPHNRIHIAHKDHAEAQKRSLNDLNFLQEFDTIHSGERGFLVGAILAVLVGLSVFEFLEGHPIASVITLFSCLIVLGYSTWLGGLIGASSDNYRLQPYHDHIERGGSVVLVDVDTRGDAELRSLVASSFPEAQAVGSSNTVDNPFAGQFFLRKHFQE